MGERFQETPKADPTQSKSPVEGNPERQIVSSLLSAHVLLAIGDIGQIEFSSLKNQAIPG
jgi:hypothetical protein